MDEIARSAQAGRILPFKGEDAGTSADDILRLARADFTEAMDFDRLNRDEAMNDMKFLGGEQWDVLDLQGRQADNRPCLTINQLPQYVRQVTGDIRAAKPAIKVRPCDDGADEELAEVYSGIIRHIENISDANTVYQTGANHAASCGMGYWRIDTDYQDDSSFHMEPRLRRINNQFSVLFDPAASDHNREDARYCFVYDNIPMKEFKARYPKANTTGWDSGSMADYLQGWVSRNVVRVAEYWVKQPVKKTLALLDDGTTLDITDIPDESMAFIEDRIKDTREYDSFKVVQYVINGSEILEGPTDWPGRYIPIIPVWGEEVQLGERVIRHGVVRFAKDAQKMYNFSRSAAVEAIAQAPKAPYMVTPEMIRGREAMWRQANTRNFAYLVYNDVVGGKAPERNAPPPVQSALMGEIEVARQDMQATTGIYNASLGAKSNEQSGKAIDARDRQAETGSNVYADNVNKAICYTGRQLIDLIPRIYDTSRTVRILGEDEGSDFVQINYPIITDDGNPAYATAIKDKKTGKMKMLPDLSSGRFDVIVTTGPSYSTRRAEAAESMMMFVQSFPQSAPLIGDLIAKNMDWPGSEAIAERLQKMLPPQLQETKDGQPAPPPPPDPMQVAEAEKAKAETEKTAAQADAEKVRTQGLQLDNAIKEAQLNQMLGGIQQAVQQAVMQALQGVMGQSSAQIGQLNPQMMPPQMPAPPPPPAVPQPGTPMPGAMPQGAPPGAPVQ